MTTGFEVHFTSPPEFIADLRLDASIEAIEGGIVRMAIRRQPALISTLVESRAFDHRPMLNYDAIFVECAYVARDQLIKLSTFVGVVYKGPAPDAATKSSDDLTNHRQAELIGQLTGIVQALAGITLRAGGQITLGDGAWIAGLGESIEAPPEQVCASCAQPIYFANDAWRHRDAREEVATISGRMGMIVHAAGRQDADFEMTCPRCQGSSRLPGPYAQGGNSRQQPCPDCRITPGVRRTLHHMADPEIVERKI